jgi:hypothetical protein
VFAYIGGGVKVDHHVAPPTGRSLGEEAIFDAHDDNDFLPVQLGKSTQDPRYLPHRVGDEHGANQVAHHVGTLRAVGPEKCLLENPPRFLDLPAAREAHVRESHPCM